MMMKLNVEWRQWALDVFQAHLPRVNGWGGITLELMQMHDKSWRPEVRFWLATCPSARQASRAAVDLLRRIGWHPEPARLRSTKVAVVERSARYLITDDEHELILRVKDPRRSLEFLEDNGFCQPRGARR